MAALIPATRGRLAIRPAPSATDVARARQEFFELGVEPTVAIHHRILTSWQRCVRSGLNIDRLQAPAPLDRVALEAANSRSEALRMLAEPELQFLTETLANTESQIILSNGDGLILDTRGDSRAINRATREALMPGIDWSEARMGTNAIGTAIAENHMIEIWGNEHFHTQHRRICCTAAPILDHTGTIAGLLDVSGDARLPRGYARSLVKRAVREIEHRWVLNAPERLARLSFHPSFAYLGSYQEGVLLIDDGCVVGANRAALRLLECDWSVIGKPLQTLLDPSATPSDLGTLLTRRGQLLQARFQHGRTPSSARVAASATASATAPSAPPAVPADQGEAWLSERHRVALQRTQRAIDNGLSTIILGETGCGKEVFARLAHQLSARCSGPFVAINCAALPESLIEAELFGYCEGAFTGALRKGSPGRILEADRGVLFLDEIGDMPLPLQARLLRVLQDRQVVPLGGGKPRSVDCAVICATHRDLDGQIAAGGFRADLFYRLHDHQVELPSWRSLPAPQRSDALDYLWLRAGAPARGMRLSDAARALLLAHDWPGNLRQLASTLRTLVALGDAGELITPEMLPSALHQAPPPPPSTPSLSDLSDAAIRDALERHHGRVAPAARELGIHRATLYRRISQLGLPIGRAKPVAENSAACPRPRRP